MKRTLILLVLVISSLTNLIHGQSLDSKIEDLITNEIQDQNGPGAVFLIAKNGEPIYQKAFGKANLELDVNLEDDYVFQLGSMTKQFTAVAIMMLKEQGKLDTNDFISKFIPDYPNGNNIRIHHLLTHTSGIKDFTTMKSLREIAQKEMSPKMMVDFFKNEPVDFAPGEKFDYNNSGYVLLGYLIELISKDSYQDFIEKNIFQKIGMLQSIYATDRQIIKRRAYGYQKKESGYVNKTVINYSIPYSSGALMSTITDMLKWQNALRQNLLLSPESAISVFSKHKLNNGEEVAYGYGWHIREINGIQTREHGGSIFGFKTMGVYIPTKDIYVIGFTNCDCISPTKITQNIAKLLLDSEVIKN
ncbi:serine hydrolase domain-containing protein [Flavobacterium sp. 25HG05S-40]|uniref:serine hydrolase domain-containing protein n=1 Tax=Flavobacterium sp. 25HG05S-40 TaxID=3458682 RepID=UPI00404484BC